MTTLAKEFKSPHGLNARQAVINIMEATHFLPGVFCIQMLSWRQKLADVLHNPQILTGYSSLEYLLPLSTAVIKGLDRTRSVAVQTKIVSPHPNEMLEFSRKQFQLKWVLDS